MSFDAADPGTPEEAWSGYRAGLPELDTGPMQRLVVAAAHPDDETLMAGGLIAHAASRGLPVVVLLASSGEGSHPHSPTWTPEALAAEREQEVAAAVARLAPEGKVLLLRLPDGALADHEAEITAALVAELASADTLVSTWSGDQHPDHAAVARAAAAAAGQRDAVHLEAPVWLWHWGDPEETTDLPEAARFDLDPAALADKLDAIALHTTQVEPLSPAEGDEVLLSPRTIAHFIVDSEIVFPTSPARAVDFDGMYAASDDPWGFDARWYEQRKRAIMLASLPRLRFHRVLEIGCSVGTTTAALADRADAVVATDVAERAVEQARERLRGRAGVVVEQLRLPEEWPEAWSAEPFDLIVLSEVGFYLGGEALGEVVDRSRAALAPGGLFVACHWRPHVLGLDRGGDEVHRVIREGLGARRLVEHVEDDFVLEVFQTEPSASVAAATGLR
jgi:LmbE family N-acetylglucosaminyl deacetylase/SAM-dependent methyltransferase